MKQLYLIATVVICLASCARREEDCTDPGIAALAFHAAIPDSVTDDSVHFSKYAPRTGLAQPIYEYDQRLVRVGKDVKLIFPANVRAEAYDWKITLYPSGKIYWLTDIHYSDDKVKQPRFHKVLIMCGNKLFYAINDVNLVYDPGGPFSGITLPINY